MHLEVGRFDIRRDKIGEDGFEALEAAFIGFIGNKEAGCWGVGLGVDFGSAKHLVEEEERFAAGSGTGVKHALVLLGCESAGGQDGGKIEAVQQREAGEGSLRGLALRRAVELDCRCSTCERRG